MMQYTDAVHKGLRRVFPLTHEANSHSSHQGTCEVTALFETRFYSHREGDLVPTGQTPGRHECYLKYASHHSTDRHLFSEEN